MTTCYVVDVTNANRVQNNNDFPDWFQNFDRVPMIGEGIVRGEITLTVKSVLWRDGGRPCLIVKWEDWRRELR